MNNDLKEYRDHVKTLAQCVIEQAAEGRDESDALHEICDGSEYAIYTGKALKCLLYCDGDNHEAWRDAYEQLPKDNPFEVAAYFALQADVAAELERAK